MAIKKFVITGLGPETVEGDIQSWLGEFGTVVEVEIIRDENVAALVAFIKMEMDDKQAFHLVSRISNYWHEGHMVNVWHLLH